MIAHIVGGFMQKIGDGAENWRWADMLRAIPGVSAVHLHEWDADLSEVIAPTAEKKLVITYSYGTAGTMRALGSGGHIDCWIIVAGVNREPEWHQHYGECWVIPEHVERAIAICTADSVIPRACPIRNESERYRNIKAWWAEVSHTSVLGLEVTRQTIIGAAEKLVALEAAGNAAETANGNPPADPAALIRHGDDGSAHG